MVQFKIEKRKYTEIYVSIYKQKINHLASKIVTEDRWIRAVSSFIFTFIKFTMLFVEFLLIILITSRFLAFSLS